MSVKSIKADKAGQITMDVLFDVLGGILYAAGVTTFASAANFAPGGITGLALILNHFFDWIPVGLCTVVLNIPVILVSYKTLGKVFFAKSVKTIIILALILDVVFPLLPVYSGDRLLAAMFAGVLSGAGLALIYARGSSTGGSDFIIMSIRKKMPHASIGTITIFTDGCILLFIGLTFKSIDAVLYAIIMTIISTIVIDKITYGMGSRKMVTIITDKGTEIANKIGLDVRRGVTTIEGRGAYSASRRDILMCACSRVEVSRIRSVARAVDEEALVLMSPLDEAYGLGFKKLMD